MGKCEHGDDKKRQEEEEEEEECPACVYPTVVILSTAAAAPICLPAPSKRVRIGDRVERCLTGGREGYVNEAFCDDEGRSHRARQNTSALGSQAACKPAPTQPDDGHRNSPLPGCALAPAVVPRRPHHRRSSEGSVSGPVAPRRASSLGQSWHGGPLYRWNTTTNPSSPRGLSQSESRNRDCGCRVLGHLSISLALSLFVKTSEMTNGVLSPSLWLETNIYIIFFRTVLGVQLTILTVLY